MVIKCEATHWGRGDTVKIKIEKTLEGVFINGRKVDKIKYNGGPQVRFQMAEEYVEDVFIVFDGRSKSPLTIKDMYEKLK